MPHGFKAPPHSLQQLSEARPELVMEDKEAWLGRWSLSLSWRGAPPGKKKKTGDMRAYDMHHCVSVGLKIDSDMYDTFLCRLGLGGQPAEFAEVKWCF